MTTVTIKTKDGLTHDFIYSNGLAYPSFHSHLFHGGLESHIQMVKELDIREDDLYLASYPKCGTHWAWEIMQMLRKGNAEYEKDSKEASFLDFTPAKEIGAMPSPRVLNSHFPAYLTPKQILEKGNRILHVQRNPKDMAVSFYNHTNILRKRRDMEPLTFSQFLPLVTGQYGLHIVCPWFKYVKDWERLQKQHPEQILTISFEDLKEDPIREIQKINTFLGYNRSDELMAEIAEACSFQNLKQADKDIKQKNRPDAKMKIDFMYRKGEVGDWKNWFTVAQNEMMDAWIEENLVDTGLKFRYTI